MLDDKEGHEHGIGLLMAYMFPLCVGKKVIAGRERGRGREVRNANHLPAKRKLIGQDFI